MTIERHFIIRNLDVLEVFPQRGRGMEDGEREGERSPFVCRRIIRQEKPIRRARARISRRTLKNSRVSIFQKRTRSLVHS